MPEVLSQRELEAMDAYWRAANYLSVGQIYLYDNPLLREPLSSITSSRGCSAIGARPRVSISSTSTQPADQAVRPEHDLHHRARAWRTGLVANTYLEGTYSEIYPNISRGCAKA